MWHGPDAAKQDEVWYHPNLGFMNIMGLEFLFKVDPI